MADWSHIQELDYKQLPFKCHHCHGYGDFARNYKKKGDEIRVIEKAEQWSHIHKAGSSKQSIKLKGKEPHPGNRANSDMKKNSTMQEAGNSVSSNMFIALCPVED